MTIAHLLEDFSDATPVFPEEPSFSEEVIEEAKLASFETGYSAGWDDAIDAKEKEANKISATLASSLEDLNFTYTEAQSQMIESLDPMFRVLTSVILPDTIAASFGHHVIEHLNEMAKTQLTQDIEVVVAPGEANGLRALLSDSFPVELVVREDTSFSEGQAQLRVGKAERELNSEALIGSIRESVEAFTHQFKEEATYG